MTKQIEFKEEDLSDNITSRSQSENEPGQKEIDMVKFKQKINNEISQIPILRLDQLMTLPIISSSDIFSIYSNRYKKFISDNFNMNSLIFISRIIIESKSIPLSIKKQYNMHKILTDIIKELMMNEYEITLFSLYLDHFGWISENFILKPHCLFIGLYVKKISNEEDYPLFYNYYSAINTNFNSNLTIWENEFKDKLYSSLLKPFTFAQINKRFSILKQPFSIYCKNNFIDYNCVVDKILRMSVSYSEYKQKEDDNQLGSRESNNEQNEENETKEEKEESKTINKIDNNIFKSKNDSEHSYINKKRGRKSHKQKIKKEKKKKRNDNNINNKDYSDNDSSSLSNTVTKILTSKLQEKDQNQKDINNSENQFQIENKGPLQSMLFLSKETLLDQESFLSANHISQQWGLGIMPKFSQATNSHKDEEDITKPEAIFRIGSSSNLKNLYSQSLTDFYQLGNNLFANERESGFQFKRIGSNKSFSNDNLISKKLISTPMVVENNINSIFKNKTGLINNNNNEKKEFKLTEIQNAPKNFLSFYKSMENKK